MVQMITGKFIAFYPYDILMKGDVSTSIRLSWPGLGEAILYPPENLNKKKLECGQYRSKMQMDITLDMNMRPSGYNFDQFFISKFVEFAYAFTSEAWFHTKIPEIDPYIGPRYIRVEYFDEGGSPFVNPKTGKNYYEEHIPRGAILEEADWQEITNNLVNGKVRDFGEHFLLNAKYMKSIRRYDTAIILCAVACEYKVRRCCDVLASKKKFDLGLWEMLVNSLRPRVMDYYNKIVPQLASSSMSASSDHRIRELPKRLQKLFEDRNRIMHTGMLYRGTKIKPKKIIQLVDKHIETTELVLNWLDSQMV